MAVSGEGKVWTAALIVIGDEILSGRTQDKNVAQIATWLNDQGIRLGEVRIVPDDARAIGSAVSVLRATNDYLFTTGGIGPTHDDITVDAIAGALGVPVEVHPVARRMLEEYYAARGQEVTEARLRMARTPQGAELIPNPTSGAPGIRLGNIFIMAGVPDVTASMLRALDGTIEGGRPMVSISVGAFVAESEVAELLRDTEASFDQVSIGSYPFQRDDRYGANFVIRSQDARRAQDCADALVAGLSAAGYEPVTGGIGPA
jgi:molybdenum cofactor synthesis domain-containing protein